MSNSLIKILSSTAQPVNSPTKQKKPLILAIVLGIFGAFLNNYPIELSYNISLVVGNFAFIFAAAYLRPILTLLCALICVVPFAYGGWEQTFSFIIFGCEAIFVSLLRRKNTYLPTADFLYWLIIGMPLTAAFIWLIKTDGQSYLLFSLFMNTINAVFYTAIAVILIVIFNDRLTCWIKPEQPSLVKNLKQYLHYILWVMLAFFVVAICLLFSRSLNDIQQHQFEDKLEISSYYLSEIVENYVDKHTNAIVQIAHELSNTESENYASNLAAAHQLYSGYLTMLIADHNGIITVSSPYSLMKNITDNDFSVKDRPYFSEAFYKEKLYVSSVFLGRGFGQDPIVAISAPIYAHNNEQPVGIVEGSLNLNMFEQGKANVADIGVVLTDKNDHVIFADKDLALSPLSNFYFSIEHTKQQHDLMVINDNAGNINKYLYRQVNLQNGWKIFVISKHSQLLDVIEMQYLIIFTVLFIIFIFVVLLSSQFANTLNKPLAFAIKELADEDGNKGYQTIPFEAPTEFLTLYEELRQAQKRQRKHQAVLEGKVKKRTQDLNDANKLLKELADHDSLTGLLNRRSLEKKFGELQASLSRNKVSIVVAMLDLDHFKSLNDNYGHLAGDNCLEYVAKMMKNKFDRRSDIVARFGGEEFVIITQYDEHQGVIKKLEELREDISQHHFACDEHHIAVTISIGVVVGQASYSGKIEEWISIADKQLYWVKDNGRNQMAVKHITND